MLKLNATLLLLACSFALKAQTVIATDLSAPVAYDNSIVGNSPPLGQSFSTGSTAYYLTSATLVLTSQNDSTARIRGSISSNRGSGNTPGHAMANFTVTGCSSNCTQVSLWSDNGGPGPGTLLATSTTTELDSALPSSPQNVTFSFSNIHLSPNTRYWILVASSNTSFAQWYGTNNPSGTGLANEYYLEDGAIVPDNEFGDAFLMSVSGVTNISTTPAPSTLILTLLGLLTAATYLKFAAARVRNRTNAQRVEL
jgi:hypothetical protein